MPMTVTEAESFVKQVALMTIGHDEVGNAKVEGGAGRIGMTADGKVFKFNTHAKERWLGAGKSKEMVDSCNRLRDKLFEASSVLLSYKNLEDKLKWVRNTLQIDRNKNGDFQASTQKLLNRTVTARVLNLIEKDSYDFNVNYLWSDFEYSGDVVSYKNSAFKTMESHVTRHVTGITDGLLAGLKSKIDAVGDNRFTSLIGEFMDKFKLDCRREIEAALDDESFDMKKFRDNTVADLGKQLVKFNSNFIHDEKKIKFYKQLVSAAQKEINSIASQIGRNKFSNLSADKMFNGKPHTIVGDKVMTDYIENIIGGVIGDAFDNDEKLDKCIRNLMSKLFADGCRGTDVVINGEKIPMPDSSGKDPERTPEKCMEKARSMLENLCRVPDSGEVDRKSLAAMLTLMNQNASFLLPMVDQGGNDINRKTISRDGVLPTDLISGHELNHKSTTVITTVKPGVWKADVNFTSSNNKFNDRAHPGRTYYCNFDDGKYSEAGYETSITFKSGVIGNKSGDGAPAIRASPEKTYVFYNLNPLSERRSAEQLYKGYLDNFISGKQPAFGNLLDDVNIDLKCKGKLEMSPGQLKTWIAGNKEELLGAMIKASEEDIEPGKTFGFPLFAEDVRINHISTCLNSVFSEVENNIDVRQRLCASARKTVESMFDGGNGHNQLNSQERMDFLVLLDRELRDLQARGLKVPSEEELTKSIKEFRNISLLATMSGHNRSSNKFASSFSNEATKTSLQSACAVSAYLHGSPKNQKADRLDLYTMLLDFKPEKTSSWKTVLSMSFLAEKLPKMRELQPENKLTLPTVWNACFGKAPPRDIKTSEQVADAFYKEIYSVISSYRKNANDNDSDANFIPKLVTMAQQLGTGLSASLKLVLNERGFIPKEGTDIVAFPEFFDPVEASELSEKTLTDELANDFLRQNLVITLDNGTGKPNVLDLRCPFKGSLSDAWNQDIAKSVIKEVDKYLGNVPAIQRNLILMGFTQNGLAPYRAVISSGEHADVNINVSKLDDGSISLGYQTMKSAPLNCSHAYTVLKDGSSFTSKAVKAEPWTEAQLDIVKSRKKDAKTVLGEKARELFEQRKLHILADLKINSEAEHSAIMTHIGNIGTKYIDNVVDDFAINAFSATEDGVERLSLIEKFTGNALMKLDAVLENDAKEFKAGLDVTVCRELVTIASQRKLTVSTADRKNLLNALKDFAAKDPGSFYVKYSEISKDPEKIQELVLSFKL